MTPQIKELIERLERAKGPDREIDAEIFWLCSGERSDPGVVAYFADHGVVSGLDHYFGRGWRDYVANPPWRYTASLDSAMTLVPEGWTRMVDGTLPKVVGIVVELFSTESSEQIDVQGVHTSEPIATCIAALKARTTGEGHE